MREVSLCARDKHEGCDAVGEVARVRCGVRACGGLCEAILFFPHFERHKDKTFGSPWYPKVHLFAFVRIQERRISLWRSKCIKKKSHRMDGKSHARAQYLTSHGPLTRRTDSPVPPGGISHLFPPFLELN